jgi:hypothetical protein
VNERDVELNATAASGCPEANEGDDTIAGDAYLFDFDVDPFPGFDERVPEAADTVVAVIGGVCTWELRTTSSVSRASRGVARSVAGRLGPQGAWAGPQGRSKTCVPTSTRWAAAWGDFLRGVSV